MFGVIICPKCDQARGVKLSTKKSRCPRCGTSYEVSLLRIYFITDKESELAEAVRSATIQAGGSDLNMPNLTIDISSTVGRATNGLRKEHLTKEEIEDITLELIEKQGAFTLDAFEKILMDRYPEEADRVMRRLRDEDKMRSEEDFDFDIIGGSEDRMTNREERIISSVRDLTESHGSFSKEDLKQALKLTTKDEIDELMAKLLEKGIILETQIGRFRMV